MSVSVCQVLGKRPSGDGVSAFLQTPGTGEQSLLPIGAACSWLWLTTQSQIGGIDLHSHQQNLALQDSTIQMPPGVQTRKCYWMAHSYPLPQQHFSNWWQCGRNGYWLKVESDGSNQTVAGATWQILQQPLPSHRQQCGSKPVEKAGVRVSLVECLSSRLKVRDLIPRTI